METNKKRVNFLGERKPYVRKHTVQTVLSKTTPTVELYSLCGPGCKSCSCSCTGGGDD